jgi:hypothetical protein
MMSENAKQMLMWIYENRGAATMPALVDRFGYRAHRTLEELVRRGMVVPPPAPSNVIPFPVRRRNAA